MDVDKVSKVDNTCSISLVNTQGPTEQTVSKNNNVEPVLFSLQTDCDETLQAQLTAGEFPEGVVWELISNKVIIGGTALGNPGVFQWEITIDNSIPSETIDATASVVLTGVFTIIEPVTITDQDFDGVDDSVDKCLDTPPGEAVDENGCGQTQLDDDNDGIFNFSTSALIPLKVHQLMPQGVHLLLIKMVMV